MARDESRDRTFRISTPRQIRVLMAPVRVEIIEAMMAIGRCSVRELAAELGRSPESLYYHLRQLLAIGMVEVHEHRATGRRAEAVYALVYRTIELDRTKTSPAFRAARAKAAATMLRRTERQVCEALLAEKQIPPRRARTVFLGRENVRLSRSALAELNRRLEELHCFLGASDDPDGDVRVGLTIAMCPVTGERAGVRGPPGPNRSAR